MRYYLFSLIIKPISLILEVIFSLAYRITGNPGVSIICVSLAVSILTMPLYRRADAIQEQEREKKRSMDKWVTHIQKTFKGDERVMMLNVYYRQQNYKPVYALRSSLSLLLQIPFFIAAYRFLSGLGTLQGASFLWIRDLGVPDRMFTIGSFSVNILPILMTVVNILSGMVYSKGFPLKEKMQMYGIALVFLVLLYRSPAGLVFYWTMNNVFSLIKNVYKKYVKLPAGTGTIAIPAIIVLILGILLLTGGLNTTQRKLLSVLVIVISLIPLVYTQIIRCMSPGKKKASTQKKLSAQGRKKSTMVFILAGVLLTVLTGMLIPSGVISGSPAEFVSLHNYRNPLLLIWNATAVAAGFFLFWGGILYYLAAPEKRKNYSIVYWICAVLALVNYLFFGKKLGTVSTSLVFDKYPVFSILETALNICLLLALAVAAAYIWKQKKTLVIRACSFLTIVLLALSLINIVQIQATTASLKEKAKAVSAEDEKGIQPVIHLSKKGKNVIVFMLDRSISGYLPLLLNERPDLKETYSGFVYYPNTISFGLATNYGVPPLFGGYEYTPLEMNRRSDELLADKHDEALKVMPVMFWKKGYDVTVCDPPYAGYEWVPDLSIFDEYEGMHAYNLEGKYTHTVDQEFSTFTESQRERNFFFYSLMRMIPVPLQTTLYDAGNYFSTSSNHAINDTFLNWYSITANLKNLTYITDDDTNTFYISNNKTAHDVMMLERPEYTPAVLLSQPDREEIAGEISDGVTLTIHANNESEQAHYDCDMASFLQIGNWIKYLKENSVYDNTRIIIVADHGYRLGQYSIERKWADNDIECLNPLLMVKDFGSEGNLRTDNTFMTNADVPSIAVKDLIENPENPFTGKSINSDEKDGQQIVLTEWFWDIKENNGTTFAPDQEGHWYSVQKNLFDISNWNQLEKQPSD